MTNLERLASAQRKINALLCLEGNPEVDAQRDILARQVRIIDYVRDIPESRIDAQHTRRGIVLALAGAIAATEFGAVRNRMNDALDLLIH